MISNHSLALTHDRVPDSPPLPDILLDSVQYQVTLMQMIMIMVQIFLIMMIMVIKMCLIIDHDFSQEWGLAGSEILLMLCVASAFLVVIAHTHRSVILRR